MSEITVFRANGNGKAGEVLVEAKVARPEATGRDVLVVNRAVAVNPVDYKALAGGLPNADVVGWDAAGVVEAVGPDASKFKVGDEVYFAGDLKRPGTFASHTLVDERLVALKPRTLSFADAAALPLTSLTAFEGLADLLKVPRPADAAARERNASRTLLVVAGAGGVGSICIQLAKQVYGLRVVATASRPETAEWVRGLGADEVINHREPWLPQLEALGMSGVEYVANHFDYDKNWDQVCAVLKPFGAVYLVTGQGPVDLAGSLLFKSLSVSMELMYTRSLFNHEAGRQGEALAEVAALVDAGKVRSTANRRLPFTLAGLVDAVETQARGGSIGKTVLTNDK